MKKPKITETNWISIKDSLPEFHKDVLLFNSWETDGKKSQCMEVGCLSSYNTYMTSDGESKSCEWYAEFGVNVTHWMPLPEPPND
jgi:hypothetical protein